METGSEEFAKQIGSAATDRLAKSSLGMTYVLQEQGGVKIAEDDSLKLSSEKQAQVTNLLGITELTSQLRHSLFEQAETGSLTDASASSPETKAIANQDEFARELLGENPKLIDKLAEITAKARVFTSALDQQRSEATREIEAKVKTWERTIDEIAQTLCSDETEKANYLRLVEDNITKLNSPSQRTINGGDGQPKTTEVESYASRLSRLIQKPRAIEYISSYIGFQQGEALADNVIDEYLETAFTLNAVRVLDRIQRPLGFNGKFRKLTSCLEGREVDPAYAQIIESNGLNDGFIKLRGEIEQVHNSSLTDDEKKQKIHELNDNFKERCRPVIEGSFTKDTDRDEAIDLVGTRDRIADLSRQASEINKSSLSEDEKKQRLAGLDRQMQSLLIPIANKVDRLFPHKGSTNLADVLEKEDAICAGKVNVLLAISKYLGINARANSVKEILDNNTAGHVCYECDLPSGAKLVVDANFSNKYGLEGKMDDELIARIRRNNPGISDPEVESSLRYTHLAIANARFIPTDSRVLIYATESTGRIITSDEQLQEARNNPNLMVRINPYTGQKEIWKANVPYPHLITSPDKDGYLHINSSFTNNTAHFTTKDYTEVGVYLFKKHIEMSPYDARAYTGLAGLLPEGEGVTFLEKIKETQPALYWEGMSTDHALMYAHQGNLEAAAQLFEETRVKNPSAYYKKIHELSQHFRNKADKETGEEAIRLKTKAKELMETARMDNPAVFYSDQFNVTEMIRAYGDQVDKKIEVYEQFKNTQETTFWDTSDYSPPFQKLMELYLEQAKKDPALKSKAVEFATEIKAREPRYYAKKAHSYASGLFLEGQEKDPSQAVSMLETAKNDAGTSFFQEDDNVTVLAKAYEGQGDRDKAIALFEESKTANPESFWSRKYGPLYESLIRLYTKASQPEKAVAVCEEARDKSQQFWEASYSGGYSQLASLYAEAKRLPEAIAVSTEAQLKDPNFLNPQSSNGGYTQLASLYAQNGQTGEAIRTMQLGQEIDKNYWTRDYSNPNVFKLVDYLEKNNQFGEAVSALEQVRERNGEYWKTDYYKICDLYQKSGNTEKSAQIRVELIGIYEGLKTSDQELYYRSTEKLAQLYLGEAQTEKAIQALEEGKNNFDYFPIRSIITLAELYLQTGDIEKAKLAYQDAVEGYKNFNRPENIQYVIDRAKAHGIEITSA